MPVFFPVTGTRIGRSVSWRPRLASHITSWITLVGAPMREYPYPIEIMSGTVEKNMSIVEDVPSINYHIWKPCNMSCKFCFATFQDGKSVLPKGHLRGEDAAALVDALCEAGFRKINFAGGEPTLCPWLPNLIRRAKRFGLATSIVTNGSRITPEYLRTLSGNLDWIALSVDSVNPCILRHTGRMTRRGPMSADTYLKITRDIKRHGIRLKVNTVVNRLNHEEDLSAFIRSAGPERWKIFQALAVEGQNDRGIANMAVTPDEFWAYVKRNRGGRGTWGGGRPGEQRTHDRKLHHGGSRRQILRQHEGKAHVQQADSGNRCERRAGGHRRLPRSLFGEAGVV